MDMNRKSGQSPINRRLAQHEDFVSLFLATVRDRGGTVAVRASDGSSELTYDQLLGAAQQVAGALRAIGVGRRDTVALMMTNRPEFFPIDLASLAMGAIPFSLYNSASPQQLADMLVDAGTRIAFCDGAFAGTLREAVGLGAELDLIVVVDAENSQPGGNQCTLAAFMASADPLDFVALARSIGREDGATLIYTSGSTGKPQGGDLSHANLIAEVRAINIAVPQIEDGTWVSYLPAAHIGDRARSYYGSVLAFGHTVTTVRDAKTLREVLQLVRPIYFGGPPRIWEKFRVEVERSCGLTADHSSVIDDAIATKARAFLGFDRAAWIVTGSAPTEPGQFEFFDALGIQVNEIWGMTETCSIAMLNTPSQRRIGSIGRAIAGLEAKVGSDAELLIRGPTVASAYRGRPEETAEAFDADGWFHTGDLARVDEDGFWWLTGRKKDIMINAAGKNMSPSNIEAALKAASSIISQACVIGDRRPYNVALLTLDPVVKGARDSDDATLIDDVQAAVDRANGTLSRVEQIKRFTILPDEWGEGSEELTPTMKLRRPLIAEKYNASIEQMYAKQQPELRK